MSSAANNINLPISGHAVLIDEKREISFDITVIDNTTENINGQTVFTGSYVPGGTVVGSTSGANLSSALVVSNPTIDANNNIIIATVTHSADAGFHFDDLATISVENAPDGANFSLTPDLVITTNSDDQITSRFYRLKLNSNVSIPNGLDCKVFIHYAGVSDRETITTSKKEIKQIIYGPPEIPIGGTTKRIKIVGDVGAEFDLTITKNSDNTSIMSTTLANADIIHIPAGLIRGLNKTLTTTNTDQLLVTYEFDQIFPSASSNEIYHINVTPKGSTTLDSNLEQVAPQGIIYQYINPTITLDTDAGTNYTVTSKTTIAYKGRPNKNPDSLGHIKTVKKMFSFTYVYTRTGGHTFTVDHLPVWSMTDASSDWDQSVTNHGNIIEIFNITAVRSSANTVATVTGDVIIKKFGTANVTFNLDSSEFLTSA
jgi:hypothetical protein